MVDPIPGNEMGTTESPLNNYEAPSTPIEMETTNVEMSQVSQDNSTPPSEGPSLPTSSHDSLPNEKKHTQLSENPKVNEICSSLQRMQKVYKQKYEPVPYQGKEQDAQYFFLSLEAYQEIIDRVPEMKKMILESIGKLDDKMVEQWDRGIEQILFKALVSESVKYGQYLAEKIGVDLKDKESVKILELCTGAGITTVMTYLERLNSNPHGETQIVSIDNSVESIACASLLVGSFGIPFTVCTRDSLLEISESFKGVVFVVDDAISFVNQSLSQGDKYDAVLSDNGISYFTEGEHNKVLANIFEKLPGIPVFLASLERGRSVKLGLPFKMKGIFKGANFMVREGDDGYVLDKKTGIISETYTRETKAFFELANKMLKKGAGDLVKLLGVLSKATKSSQNLNKEIQTPISVLTNSFASNFPTREIVDQYPDTDKAPCKAIIIK